MTAQPTASGRGPAAILVAVMIGCVLVASVLCCVNRGSVPAMSQVASAEAVMAPVRVAELPVAEHALTGAVAAAAAAADWVAVEPAATGFVVFYLPQPQRALGGKPASCGPAPKHEHRHDGVVTPHVTPRDRLAPGLEAADALPVCTEARTDRHAVPVVADMEIPGFDLSRLGVLRV